MTNSIGALAVSLGKPSEVHVIAVGTGPGSLAEWLLVGVVEGCAVCRGWSDAEGQSHRYDADDLAHG